MNDARLERSWRQSARQDERLMEGTAGQTIRAFFVRWEFATLKRLKTATAGDTIIFSPQVESCQRTGTAFTVAACFRVGKVGIKPF